MEKFFVGYGRGYAFLCESSHLYVSGAEKVTVQTLCAKFSRIITSTFPPFSLIFEAIISLSLGKR